VFLGVLLLPLWMWIAWLLTPKKKLVVAIVDKTVTTTKVQEHVSLDWVLRHERYTKTRDALYQPDRDYFGFFPGKEEQYTLKGLERLTDNKIQELSEDADAAYFSDTYGVYSNEWYAKRLLTERSALVYGGMTMQDISLLTAMKEKHKLMIAEFNAIGSPTSAPVRSAFETLFGMHWSGWTGRYFSDLDTASNKELPHWLVHNYIAQHGGKWPFHRPGLAFVSNSDEVTILEEGTMVEDAVPVIESTPAGMKALGIPAEMRYPFWFDVIDSMGPGNKNELAAAFVVKANAAGVKELARYGLRARFPAVIMHRGGNAGAGRTAAGGGTAGLGTAAGARTGAADDYGFYYFSGDFCDNPITTFSAYFKGVSFFSKLLYDGGDPADRVGFFWDFYRPMMTRILRDYYAGLKR
jgi:hypothetical protein